MFLTFQEIPTIGERNFTQKLTKLLYFSEFKKILRENSEKSAANNLRFGNF